MSESSDLKFHDYSNLFPLMTGNEFQALISDMERNGQYEPIVLFEGKILDGRNRYRACQELGASPVFDQFDGDDPLTFVLSKNLYRRQLSVAQRALVAASLSSLKRTDDADQPAEGHSHMEIEDAAIALSVSPRTVSSACKVVRDGTPALLEAVQKGKVSVSAAEQVAKLDHDEQDALCTKGANAIRKAAKEMREAKRPGDEGKHKTEEKISPPFIEEAQVHSPPHNHAESDYPRHEPDAEAHPTHTAPQLLASISSSAMAKGLPPDVAAEHVLEAIQDADLEQLAYAIEVALKIRERIGQSEMA